MIVRLGVSLFLLQVVRVLFPILGTTVDHEHLEDKSISDCLVFVIIGSRTVVKKIGIDRFVVMERYISSRKVVDVTSVNDTVRDELLFVVKVNIEKEVR